MQWRFTVIKMGLPKIIMKYYDAITKNVTILCKLPRI